MVIWVSQLKAPSAGVSSVTWQKLEFEPSLSLDIEAKLWVNNPNGWPLSGSLLKASADVFSLDRTNDEGEMYLIGEAGLGSKVEIATHATTSFSVVLNRN